MMMGFLASLSGGLVEEASIDGKFGSSNELSGKIGLKAQISNLLSSLIGGGIEAEGAGKLTDTTESHYSGVVKFPAASLFIQLRELLVEQGLVLGIATSKSASEAKFGDLIEFEGDVMPNPATQIRHLYDQLMPVIEPYFTAEVAKGDEVISQLKLAKVGKPIVIQGETFTFSDQKEIMDTYFAWLIMGIPARAKKLVRSFGRRRMRVNSRSAVSSSS